MRNFLIILVFLTMFAVALPAAAQTKFDPATGQGTYTPLEPLPCPVGTPNCQSATNNFPAFVSTVFRLLITFGGLFAVVMIVVAGIGYMISESAVDIDKAKSRAKAALWGLLLLTGSWLILNTINPNLLIFKLTIPTAGPSISAGPSGGNFASGQQNLGDPTKFSNGNPYGFSDLSVTQGYAVNQALGCSFYNVACLGAQQYITYDPNLVGTPDVQTAITNYNSNCSGASNTFIGNVKTIDGSIVGSPGQTALVCAGPFQ